MKIGIMTFWWSQDNYGQLLQCYALQKYLRDAGHDAYLIRYDSRYDNRTPIWRKVLKALNVKQLTRYINFLIGKKKLVKGNQSRYFDLFREKYIKQSEKYYGSYFELKKNPPEADVYIVGSDQVWNFSLGNPTFKQRLSIIHAYMLDFGSPSTVRMSYAASWSVKSLSSKLIKEIKPLLNKFSWVSVREQNGVELCGQCGFFNAEFVCDPTLLLKADTYRDLYINEEIQKVDKKYVLLYMLDNECDFNIQKVYDFAAIRGLNVVYVTGNGVVDNRKKFYATIPEWLYLIDNAEYVITNSFHCCVFSSLFSKKYGVVKLKGKKEGMNERMESLFSLLGIKSRYVNNEDFQCLDESYVLNTENKKIPNIRDILDLKYN